MADGVRLIVFGRQGAGKGTQCARLAAHYGVPHISTGDMLRAAVRDGTEFGEKAKSYMDEGKLLPDDIMVGLVAERLAQADAHVGWLLDGFPRTPGQADALSEVTADAPFDLAVNLDVPEEVVLERITNRRVCTECGTIYSVAEPPTTPWDCDKCGGTVVQREDDTEEAVRKRLADYQTQTAPLMSWFEDRDKLVTIDGNPDADTVFARVVSAIEGS
ncbi:MAG: adenylate kinase [Microthrixaceae bacterium]